MAMESAIFKQRSPHKFSDTNQISLADFTHFEQPFSLQNSKTTYSATFKSFSYVLKISSKSSLSIFKKLLCTVESPKNEVFAKFAIDLTLKSL